MPDGGESEKNAGSSPAAPQEPGSSYGPTAFSLGVVALVLPVIGLVLGIAAAVTGSVVRRRAARGEKVGHGNLKLASYGTFLGLIAVVINLVLTVVLAVIRAARASGR